MSGIISGLKSVSPKQWLMIGGGFVAVLLVMKKKSSSAAQIVTVPAAASSGASTSANNGSTAAIQSLQTALGDMQNKMQKSAVDNAKTIADLNLSLTDKLTAAHSSDLTLIGSLTDKINSAHTADLGLINDIKGSIGTINTQLHSVPDISTSLKPYDTAIATLTSTLQSLQNHIATMNQPVAVVPPAYYYGGSGGGSSSSPSDGVHSSPSYYSSAPATGGGSTSIGSGGGNSTTTAPHVGNNSELIISKIQENAAKWNGASDSEKQKLHDSNIDLATSIGAVYDSSGTWTYNGRVIN